MKNLAKLFLLLVLVITSSCSDDEASPNTTVVVPANQQTPVITASNIFISIDENTISNTNIGFATNTVTNGSVVSYEMLNLSAPGTLKINSQTGGIFIDQTSLIDFELNPIITGNILITSNFGVSKTVDFTIALLDIFNLAEDIQALSKLYFTNSNNTLDWDLLAPDISNWTGVTVENDRVTKVEIANKGIETIPSISLYNLTELTILDASNNAIDGDVSFLNNLELTNVSLSSNQIDSLNFQNALMLAQLEIDNNNLTDLNVSTLTNLTDLAAHSNNLSSCNIANGNNSNMIRMELQNNSSLTCIKVDTGATSGFTGWIKPTPASYNTTCP